MPGGDVVSCQGVLEVPAKLRPVVTLYHSKGEAEGFPSGKDSLGSQSLPQTGGHGDVRHSAIEIDDGVVIQFPATVWINMVNRVDLNQFTGFGNVRTPRVILSQPLFSCPIEAVVAPQDAAPPLLRLIRTPSLCVR